jgi:hypothetical protein
LIKNSSKHLQNMVLTRNVVVRNIYDVHFDSSAIKNYMPFMNSSVSGYKAEQHNIVL